MFRLVIWQVHADGVKTILDIFEAPSAECLNEWFEHTTWLPRFKAQHVPGCLMAQRLEKTIEEVQ